MAFYTLPHTTANRLNKYDSIDNSSIPIHIKTEKLKTYKRIKQSIVYQCPKDLSHHNGHQCPKDLSSSYFISKKLFAKKLGITKKSRTYISIAYRHQLQEWALNKCLKNIRRYEQQPIKVYALSIYQHQQDKFQQKRVWRQRNKTRSRNIQFERDNKLTHANEFFNSTAAKWDQISDKYISDSNIWNKQLQSTSSRQIIRLNENRAYVKDKYEKSKESEIALTRLKYISNESDEIWWKYIEHICMVDKSTKD